MIKRNRKDLKSSKFTQLALTRASVDHAGLKSFHRLSILCNRSINNRRKLYDKTNN
nr:MAG TPA: hypothetical protein [Caudoviricetes sp.]DAU04687.1 MAG TPA: hypothetical protein [Caudoviricetes sp.]